MAITISGMNVFAFDLIFFTEKLIFGETNSPPHATERRFETPLEINSTFVCRRLSPVILVDTLVQKQASQAIINAITKA